MTAQDYWYGDVWLIEAWREADRLRQQRANHEAWLQGAYIYDAIGRLAPALNAFAGKRAKAQEYPAEPYGISREEKRREEAEDREVLRAKIYMNNMVRAGRGWGKK